MTRPKVIPDPAFVIDKVGQKGYELIISGTEFLIFQYKAVLKIDSVEISSKHFSKAAPDWITLNERLAMVFANALVYQPENPVAQYPVGTTIAYCSIYCRLAEDGELEWRTDIDILPVPSLIAAVPQVEEGIKQVVQGL